ncbi:MAG: M48 family metallopeptidase [Lysobacter sp.]|nr:M48 family metallopeptidase [Lysobacter sp.]
MRQNPFGNQQQQGYGGQRKRGINPRFIILLLFAGYAAYYWVSNRQVDPYTGEKVLIDGSISIDQEKAMGLQAYEDILSKERPVDPNSQIAQQVREIAKRLIAKVPEVEAQMAADSGNTPNKVWETFDWDVNVIQSDQANAFCLPGGKMAVYTGLIPVAQNADAVAVVMGHEIAHALLRHGAQRMSQQKLGQLGQMAGAMSGMDPQSQQMMQAAMGYGFMLPYARKHETQADAVGLMLAAAACFNPEESVPLWERMSAASGGRAPAEFSSTHPSPETRIRDLQALMPKAMEYKQKFCRQ